MESEEMEAEIGKLKGEIERIDIALEMMDERMSRALERLDERVSFVRNNAEMRR